MNQNRPLLITAVAAVLLLGISFQHLGGLDGIQSDPTMSLSVVGMMALVSVPVLWLSYRRQKREPMFVELEEPTPNSDDSAHTTSAPQVIVASRWKAAVRCLLFMPSMFIIALVGLAQHGVCQVAIMAVWTPVLLSGFVTAAAGILFPERLVIAAEGLTRTTAWRTQRWTWNEVRHVTLIRTRIPFTQKQLSIGVTFQRYAPADSARGAWRHVFHPIWPMGNDELADTLNRARAQWSTNAGASFVPVPKSPLYYMRTAGLYVAIGLTLWVLIAGPCGAG